MAKEKAKEKVKEVATNVLFAKTDVVFKKACEIASMKLEEATGGKIKDRIKPTQRQASKYRNKKGSAYTHRKEASAILAQEKE